MKKFLKFSAVLTALVLGLCLVACSDGGSSNDGGGSSNNGGNVSNNGGGNTNNGGGNSNNGNSNNDEEVVVKPKVTVVATYQDLETYSSSYIFYSDNTYEVKEGRYVYEKGKYSGDPKTRGRLTLVQLSYLDPDIEEYIPYNYNYILFIDKDGDELYLRDEEGEIFYVKI